MESNDRQDHHYLLYSYRYSYVIKMVLLEKKIEKMTIVSPRSSF